MIGHHRRSSTENLIHTLYASSSVLSEELTRTEHTRDNLQHGTEEHCELTARKRVLEVLVHTLTYKVAVRRETIQMIQEQDSEVYALVAQTAASSRPEALAGMNEISALNDRIAAMRIDVTEHPLSEVQDSKPPCPGPYLDFLNKHTGGWTKVERKQPRLLSAPGIKPYEALRRSGLSDGSRILPYSDTHDVILSEDGRVALLVCDKTRCSSIDSELQRYPVREVHVLQDPSLGTGHVYVGTYRVVKALGWLDLCEKVPGSMPQLFTGYSETDPLAAQLKRVKVAFDEPNRPYAFRTLEYCSFNHTYFDALDENSHSLKRSRDEADEGEWRVRKKRAS